MSTLTPEMEKQLKNQAAQYFNQTWDLLDKPDRTPGEDLTMIHQAHASRFLWGLVGQAKQRATGEWQVSRVYATLSMGESSLLHAEASLSFCQQGALTAFDFAFAHEAIARAQAVLRHHDAALQELAIADTFAQQVPDAQDKNYVLGELQAVREMLNQGT